MPSLVRFLVTLGVLAAIGYGAMVALVTFVEPREGDMTIRIPAERLQPPAQ
ncbi:MAG: histidine kinase [Mesorhizobium amorphae]|nr:MAG: histidine kinase [Mesorhizobium amorphae]